MCCMQSFGFGRPPSINLAYVDCEIPSGDLDPLEPEKSEVLCMYFNCLDTAHC